jgi:hypothetical protein
MNHIIFLNDGLISREFGATHNIVLGLHAEDKKRDLAAQWLVTSFPCSVSAVLYTLDVPWAVEAT